MTRVWSYRPQLLHLGLFFAAYVLGCGFAQALAIVPGTGISIWPPSGLFIATLMLAPKQSWPWWVLVGGLGELFGNVLWFHSPLPAAILIYAGNALEAMVGAWLVNKALGRPVRLETLREVLVFIALGAGVAPLVSATVGSATLAWFGIFSQTFLGAWPLWWIGDATGVLIVGPLALVVIQNWSSKAKLSVARWLEACVVGLILLGVAALSLGGYLPFAYIVMPPLLWAAVRFEFKGAAVTLALLALITAIFTISGASQFAGNPESQRHNQIMLQLFLAISAFSALIIAAISRQHQLALLTLRQSVEALRDRERELSQIVNMVPVHIRRLTPEGEPTFFNKRLVDFFGLDLQQLKTPGTSQLAANIETLVHPDDAPGLLQAVRHAVATGEPYSMKYRMRRSDGVYRWVDGRGEPLRDEGGKIVQWFAISIDIDDEVRAQEALRQSEQKLQQLIDAVPALIWATTSDGMPSYINKRFRDVTGASLADITAPDGSPSLSVIHPEDADAARQAIQHSFRTGDPYIQRYRQRRTDGTYRWTETRAEPLRDDTGTILQWYGASVDIHDLVIAQEALQQSERRYRDLFHYMPIGLAQVDAGKLVPLFKELRAEAITDLKAYIDKHPEFLARALEALEIEEANRHLTEMLGANDQEEVRGPITRYWQPGLATIRRAIESRYRGEEVFQEETKVARMDGSVMHVVFATARPGAVADKSLVGFIDITERKKAEEALRNRERELSQLVDALPVHIWSWTPAGELAYVNKRSLEDLGLSKANFEDTVRVAQKLVHPEDAPHVLRASANSLKTGEAFMMRYRRRWKDGNYRWIEARAQPLRDQDGAIVHWYQVSIDIDDQVQAEEALKSSKRQLEQMIDTLPINILSFAPSRRMTYASRRYLDNVGPPTPDIEDFDSLARDLAHPEDFPIMFQRAKNGFATGQPFINRFRRRTKDGAYRWIEARAQPLLDADGAIVQWYIISIDIEDEMLAQEALRERERFLWQLVETLPAMIDCAAPNGEPVYRSQQLREFLGYELEDLDGTKKSRLNGTLDAGVHPEDLAGVKEQYARCLSTGEPYARRHRLRRFDGEYRWVETRAAPMRDNEGAIVQWNVICLDVDGEVRMQEELRMAHERLARASQAASLAELSASIAHEVNQPLAAIVANSHACYRWLSADPVNVERAKITTERVIRDANSAAEVVSRVRALFKQSVENRISLSLSGVITEACNLVAGEALRRRIRIDIDVEDKLPPMAVDRVQIQQVLINLIRNGMEAMDAVAGEKTIGVRAHRAGSEVQTEIGDRGDGIEFPDQIFEPFFTTKENGMGMGLAICRSIVEAHGGRLWAEKNEPRGARFIFTLPTVGKAAP
ncbi:PAS domain-containing protein (plasmid) [Rhizobium sp. CB3090]|uniref:PAS domain-containing protein n=1 Tax=Rhizobium sp. CB3090 TaxID=3039156 RepID=UPI0024B1E066|nr:PAS domain-containing protein [Rhizobium sp. CB3090]WFU13276.1 PAS domain-containing protein [Rhizobium sp. CB3090]